MNLHYFASSPKCPRGVNANPAPPVHGTYAYAVQHNIIILFSFYLCLSILALTNSTINYIVRDFLLHQFIKPTIEYTIVCMIIDIVINL